MDWACCGTCCASFSIFAIIFLVSIRGVILSGSESIPVEGGHNEDAAAYCAAAAVFYGVCVLISLGCIYFKRYKEKAKEQALSAERQPLWQNSRRNNGFKNSKVRTESPQRRRSRENSFDAGSGMIGSPDHQNRRQW